VTDWGQVGVIAAEMIDDFEKTYADQEVEIGMVALVVEVTGVEEGRDEEDNWTGVFYRTNEPRRWIQVGFFEAAKRAVIDSMEDANES